MKTLTYEEYKIIHKKLTNSQRAYYEKEFGYRTRLREETERQELEDFRKKIQETVQKIKDEIKNKRK